MDEFMLYEEDFPYDELMEEYIITQLLEEKEEKFFNLPTKDLIKLVKGKGISIKDLSTIADINVKTLYNFNCGYSNLSKEKEEKIRNILFSLLDEGEFCFVTQEEIERRLKDETDI